MFIFGCQETIEKAAVTFNPSSADIEKLDFYSIEKDLKSTVSNEMPTVEFILDGPTLLSSEHKYQQNYVYLEPGMAITLDTISLSPLRLACSDCGAENAYLSAYSALEDRYPFSFRESQVGYDSFEMKLAFHFEPFDSLLRLINADTEISTYFKELMDMRKSFQKANHLLRYESTHEYLTDTAPTLPNNYMEVYKEMDLTSSNILAFDEGRSFLLSWHTKDIDFEKFPTVTDYFKNTMQSAKKTYGETLVGEYCYQKELLNQLNFGGGIDEVADVSNDFMATSKNNYLIASLEEQRVPWLKLRKELPAPNFTAFTRDGEEVSLSDLKGKRIYVDVWATWCGPCIREIPALKELEEDLHEQVEFVSVSIDKEDDKEKWLSFLTEKELKGTQLMTEGAWESDLVKDYNVKGIPRFFLIDEGGSIINSNAPRPSSEGIREVLLN